VSAAIKHTILGKVPDMNLPSRGDGDEEAGRGWMRNRAPKPRIFLSRATPGSREGQAGWSSQHGRDRLRFPFCRSPCRPRYPKRTVGMALSTLPYSSARARAQRRAPPRPAARSGSNSPALHSRGRLFMNPTAT
jgi:hypothetical protein